MIYDFFDERGYCRWSGEDREALFDYLKVRSKRPPRRGTRPYTLQVRAAGQPTVMFALRMDVGGRITVGEMLTMQALPEVPLEDALRHLLFTTPPSTYAPPPTARSVWERLKDPWPTNDESAPEGARSPAAALAQTTLLTPAELDDFAQWGALVSKFNA